MVSLPGVTVVSSAAEAASEEAEATSEAASEETASEEAELAEEPQAARLIIIAPAISIADNFFMDVPSISYQIRSSPHLTMMLVYMHIYAKSMHKYKLWRFACTRTPHAPFFVQNSRDRRGKMQNGGNKNDRTAGAGHVAAARKIRVIRRGGH